MAVLLVCATFPLIWVGGLVTTTDAGMAVPDWPSTYGYNLFLYPISTWVSGPWDLFIEHGHRLLGSLVGMIAIAFMASCFWKEDRKWMRRASIAALALVILQGVIGGARVLLNDRIVAMIHGCVGPAFFGLAVALAVMTSRFWRSTSQVNISGGAGLRRLALATMALAYFQLILGALVRHAPATTSTDQFQVSVLFHIVIGIVLSGHILLLNFLSWRRWGKLALMIPTSLSSMLVLCQLLLGAGTWIVRYGWPPFAAQWSISTGYVVEANSMMQSLTVTAHVANGSLILGMSVAAMLVTARLFQSDVQSAVSSTLVPGVAA